MNKFLTFEIKESQPLPYVLLNNDVAIDQIEQQLNNENSLIYFISKVKKVRFDLDSLKLNFDTININLIFEGKKIPSEFSILNGKALTIVETSTKLLKIEVEGVENPKPMLITPDLVLRKLNGFIGNKPELIYIGYSFTPIKRLRSHEKIVKANAAIEDNEELRLYINSFTFSLMEILPDKTLVCLNNIGIKKGVVSKTVLKQYIMLVERIFINYFQTDGLNDDHINLNFMKDPILKELLRNKDIRFFGGGYDMHEQEYFDFWSRKQKNNNKTFCFDFENPDLGFLPLEQTQQSFLQQ